MNIRTQGDKELLENEGNFIPKRHQVKYGGLGSGEKEWDVENDNRIFIDNWGERYKYEAEIISNIIKENNYSKVLELGSGPGRLADIIQEIYPQL